MKKFIIGLVLALVIPVLFAVPAMAAKSTAVTIQDGVLTYSATHYLAGQPLQTGYDMFGYNYQAHLFNGSYANVYLGSAGFPPYTGDTDSYLAANPTAASTWYWPYRDVQLEMKWNDAWISNKDADGDGKLDRHYGYPTYRGSGAWETNHMSGKYTGEDGQTYVWTDFVKIVAAPADAVRLGEVWYTAGGSEIGADIWGEFAIIQEIYNDHYYGFNGKLYLSPTSAGFGRYGPQKP